MPPAQDGLFAAEPFAGFGPSRFRPAGEVAVGHRVRGRSQAKLGRDMRVHAPKLPGVYGMLDARGKLIYSVTLSDDQVKFPFGRAEIGDEAKGRVDEAIATIKAENRGVYFEIHGHTDATGPEEYNQWLGEQRAIMVRNYLHDTHGIALNRLQVVSYGESQPVVDNKTREHRAENRRVVIQILE